MAARGGLAFQAVTASSRPRMTLARFVQQAQDVLASAAMHGGRLPPSIEDGAAPPDDLSEFRSPAMVVVIPFAASVARAAAE